MKINSDDLYFAADWVEAYEAQDDDDNGERIERTVAWLRAQADKQANFEYETLLMKTIQQATGKKLSRLQVRELIAKQEVKNV